MRSNKTTTESKDAQEPPASDASSAQSLSSTPTEAVSMQYVAYSPAASYMASSSSPHHSGAAPAVPIYSLDPYAASLFAGYGMPPQIAPQMDGSMSSYQGYAPLASLANYSQFAPSSMQYGFSGSSSSMATSQSTSSATTQTTSFVSESTKKSKRKKDPQAPKNPLSAYLFFVTEERAKLAGKSSKSFSELARELGQQWKDMSDEEKSPYLELAKKDKERFRYEKKAFERRRRNSDNSDNKKKKDDGSPRDRRSGSGDGDIPFAEPV